MCATHHTTSFNKAIPHQAEVNRGTCNIPSNMAPPGIFLSLSPSQMTALQRSDPVLKYVWKRWDQGLNPKDVVKASNATRS